MFPSQEGKAKKSVRLMMDKLIGMEFELMLFWSSAVAKTINGEVQLHALVDGKRIVITKTSVRRSLRLADAEDKVVHKERGDSLVRFAATVSSLETEQDSGNIVKTQSKATLNEPSSTGTSSGGGHRCQETMGDTIAQTRFENVSTQSYDPLFARGNTLQNGEDSLKLKELMELCTNLQQRVLDLEKTKTTQAEEIVSLKSRVKKLKQKKRSRNHKLKRLRKVGATARVESFGDEESLGEDASKQGRIDAINADDDITLVSVHDVNVSAGEEEVVEVINTAKLIIDAAQVSAAGDKVSTARAATTVSVATTTTATTVEEITLAQTLEALKTSKPKVKGIVFREPEEPVKKLSKKDLLKLDEEIALKLQEEIDEEEVISRAEEEKIDEANIAWDDIQAKVNADYQLAERLQAKEQEQFIIEQKATSFKELLEQRRKHFAAKRAEEKKNKPTTKTQQKKTMITYLKNMEGRKHKDLKSKDFDSIKELFDKALKRVNMLVDSGSFNLLNRAFMPKIGTYIAKITRKEPKNRTKSYTRRIEYTRDGNYQCMRTRNSNFPNNSPVTIPRRRNRKRSPNVVEPELRTIVEVAPMAERTMEELLRAPTEGYGEAIVIPEINADHFEIKTNLL
ncbi:hypothetical protein Tco_1301283 [Tanacetum coccineum]